MSEVMQILNRIEQGDPGAARKLLPLVYDELRKLAAAKLAQEKPGQTLEATALVHEAFLRLVTPPYSPPSQGGETGEVQWDSRGHFFVAAAEAMRRILVESARRKQRLKRGGDRQRVEIEGAAVSVSPSVEQILSINEAIEKLAAEDSAASELVKLRYFVGFSVEEAAEHLGMSRAAAYRHWTYAKAWLQCELEADDME